MSTVREYDTIAQTYAGHVHTTPLNKYVTYPGLLAALCDADTGRVSGEALDLATGTGTVAEMLLDHGARSVTGIDSSRKMLELAMYNREMRRKRNARAGGLYYKYGIVGKLGKLGSFDVVAAGFLLHYAASLHELHAMCKDIAANLVPGGRFAALNNNPDSPTRAVPTYGVTIECLSDRASDGSLVEGSQLRVSYIVDGEPMSFTQYYWAKETYLDALRTAGLENASFTTLRPTDEGLAAMPAGYFDSFVANPDLVLITANKPR